MEEYGIIVPNMACEHCENVIKEILSTFGAKNIKLDLQSKKVVFSLSNNAMYEKAVSKIKEANYTVVEKEE